MSSPCRHKGPPALFPTHAFSSTEDHPLLPPTPPQVQIAMPKLPPSNTPSDIPKSKGIIPISKVALAPHEIHNEIHIALDKEECIPEQIPIREAIGKTMYPCTYALSYPAAPIIKEWGNSGCPVDCGDDWSREHIVAAISKGPHKSALNKEAIDALAEETREKVQSGYARVVT